MFRSVAKSLTLGLFLSTAAVTSVVPLAETAAAEPGIEVGMLTCRQIPNTRLNLIVYSSTSVTCVFRTSQGQELYRGKTGIGLGADLTLNPETEILFAVFMISNDARIGSHALAGHYGGVKASVSAGIGAGISALIGGGAKNVSLQPLGIEGGTGWGASAGLSYLVLEPAYHG